MEFQHTLLAALFCLGLIGACHGSESRETIPDEDYWNAVWPNTLIPNTLKDLLKPGAEDAEISDLPMKIDDTQYPKTFFFEHDLYPGKTMNVVFSKRPYAQPYGVWFYVKKHNDITKEGFTYDEACVKNPPGKGERRYCAKSLATLIGFVTSTLGNKNIEALSSSFVEDNKNSQLYTIEGVQNLGDKAVMCHRLNFQSVVFYCHEIHKTTAFMVPMVAADGTKTNALAVCHHDTSGMDPNLLYEFMKIKPGTATVCHYLGNKAVLWVPKNRRMAVDQI